MVLQKIPHNNAKQFKLFVSVLDKKYTIRVHNIRKTPQKGKTQKNKMPRYIGIDPSHHSIIGIPVGAFSTTQAHIRYG